MPPELKAISERIAVGGGDLLALWSIHQQSPVQKETWMACIRQSLVRKRQLGTLTLLVLGAGALIGAIAQIELHPNNHIERLKPLIARLDPLKYGSPSESSHSTISPPISTPLPKESPSPQSSPPSKPITEKTPISKTSKPIAKALAPSKTVPIEGSDTEKDTAIQEAGDSDGQKSKAIAGPSATEGDSLGGQGGHAEDWGSQQTALSEQSPMHFREIKGEHPIWVAETEVTQRQWVTLMGLDLSVVSGHWDQAIDGISWCKALEYANRLSKHEKRKPVYRFRGNCEQGGKVIWDHTADGYRLLHEEEWQTLAEAAPKEETVSLTNNRGIGQVYKGQSPQQNGLYGLQSNAAEWVWGAPQLTHQAPKSAVAARKCTEDNCRQQNTPSERPLGVGLRLARGPIAPSAASDI